MRLFRPRVRSSEGGGWGRSEEPDWQLGEAQEADKYRLRLDEAAHPQTGPWGISPLRTTKRRLLDTVMNYGRQEGVADVNDELVARELYPSDEAMLAAAEEQLAEERAYQEGRWGRAMDYLWKHEPARVGARAGAATANALIAAGQLREQARRLPKGSPERHRAENKARRKLRAAQRFSLISFLADERAKREAAEAPVMSPLSLSRLESMPWEAPPGPGG